VNRKQWVTRFMIEIALEALLHCLSDITARPQNALLELRAIDILERLRNPFAFEQSCNPVVRTFELVARKRLADIDPEALEIGNRGVAVRFVKLHARQALTVLLLKLEIVKSL